MTALASGPSWLASRPRPALFGTVAIFMALLAGALASYDPRYAVGVVGAGALVLAVLMWPIFGAILLVALAPATSGLATGFPLPNLRLSEAVIGVVGVTLMASVRRRDAIAWKPLDWALLAYGAGWAAFGVFADITGHQHLSIGDWGTVAGQLQFFLVFRGVRIAVRSPHDRQLAIGACLLASIPVSVLAILQELHAPGVRPFVNTITGGISGTNAITGSASIRATGPFDNWAALAGYLLPILLVLIAAGVSGVNTRHRRWFIAAGVLAVIAMAFTDEQSVIVCLIVGIVVLVRQSGKAQRFLRYLGVAGVVTAVAAGPLIIARIGNEFGPSPGTGRVTWIPQTLGFRWAVWSGQYFPAIVAHPLSGYGDVLPDTITWLATESQYISFLMEGGFPMLALFLLLTAVMFLATRESGRSPLNGPLEQATARALSVAVISMLVVNFVWPFLSNGGMPQVLWALLALALPSQSASSKHGIRGRGAWHLRDTGGREQRQPAALEAR